MRLSVASFSPKNYKIGVSKESGRGGGGEGYFKQYGQFFEFAMLNVPSKKESFFFFLKH